MRRSKPVRLSCESLDNRCLPSISLSGGVLTVIGTGGNDAISVTAPVAGQVRALNAATGEVRTFAAAKVQSIEIRCGAGNDSAVVGQALSQHALIRGGGGDDNLAGGSGDDTAFGGSGRDSLRGRNGSDDLNGDDGRDDLRGGLGDDSLDGGGGRDGCRGGDGDDDISNGTDLDTELTAVFTGGQGDAEFKFGPEDGGIEREFEVEIEDLIAATTYGVFVDGVAVGSITTDAFGDGRLEYELDFDSDHDGAVEFPAGFPEVHEGSIVQVKLNDSVVREGTFIVNPTP